MASQAPSIKEFRLFFAIEWVIWTAATAITLALWYDQPWLLAVSDSVVSNGLLAFSTFIIVNVLSFYQPGYGRLPFALLLVVGMSFLWIKVDYLILQGLYPPEWDDMLHQTLPVRFALSVLFTMLFAMGNLLWTLLKDQQESRDREADLRQMAKDAELYKLRQQLQPHFLFNSLNSINALICVHPEEARKMVQQLSDFLRGTLKREESQFIPLEEELQYLQLYLDIEKVRFGHRLKTSSDVSEEALKAKMPPLLLQPLMENAIKFGLYGTTEQVGIHLRAIVRDGHLVIAIMNPYDPDMQMPEGTGFGLKSVKRRLHLLFGQAAQVETNTTPDAFAVVIRFPLFYEHDKSNPDR
ncbi:sensor histidine kinase [Compostibacter hankyongensis]|uniref:Signal transduction histidine kinase internal region domain-containing protein n=1 Tax=Compostibacter hankyongensis TaxID=1007089 RepID=A0ABP8G8S6_9BACT